MPKSKLRDNPIETQDQDFIEDEFEESLDMDTLKTEVQRLRNREKLTVKKAIKLEMEIHSTRADRDMYRRRFLEAQSKLEQMKTSPSPVGVIEKILPGDQNRAVVKLLSGQTFVAKYITDELLQEGDTVALHQRSMTIIEILPPLLDPEVIAMELMENPTETYEEIGGLDSQIMEVREVVELSLNDPDAFCIFNISPPTGVLLYGPPGTGKTLIAKAVANATNAKFMYLAASELVQKFIGEGARMVREIFQIARDNESPVIIFVDEIDAIAARRTGDNQSGEREVNRTLMQLLAEMDGFCDNSKVRIIAATNRIDILDPAILRPGRFDRLIELPIPNEAARRNILQIHMRKIPHAETKLDELVNLTDGFSGAELKSVCTEAGIYALRDRLQGNIRDHVVQQDFVNAIQKIREKEREKERIGLAERLYT